jgi:hypothetical protein
MNVSERFRKFAAECELMAKFAPSPENEGIWHRMAERWIRCAELSERQDVLTHAGGSTKQHRKPAHTWVH